MNTTDYIAYLQKVLQNAEITLPKLQETANMDEDENVRKEAAGGVEHLIASVEKWKKELAELTNV